ncbi:MAG: biotin transporter BioY [Candidatus Avilachnospira sp.]
MKTKNITLNALFLVVMAVLSQVVITLGPVPFNLGVLGAFLTGLMLTPKNALMVMVGYIVLGFVGLPVFAGFSGGAGVLFGMTGGYIIGYIFISVISSAACKASHSLDPRVRSIFTASMMFLSLIICYAFGTAWFMFITKNTLSTSLAVCVFPFIIPDLLKLISAVFLSKALKKRLYM